LSEFGGENMKKTLMIVLILTIAVLNGYGFESYRMNFLPGIFQTGNTFTSKEGRFSATPPTGFSDFKFSSRVNPTDAGDITINQYLQNLDRGTCLMSYYDFPESLFQRKTIQKMLTDGRDQAVKNMNATVKKEDSITVDGNSGLSLVVEIPKDGKMIYARVDFIIAKPRVYNYLYLSYDQAEINKTDVKNFFKSFHVLK
jgi:hypothetical protein